MTKEKAKQFAIKKHGDQKRKYTGEPYWHHCEEVANLIEENSGNEVYIMAAWLHDTIEDTETTYKELIENFGVTIASLVYWLTDDDIKENRETRKLMSRIKLKQAPFGAKLVKLADLISNSKSIAEKDPDFAKVYMKEKKILLESFYEMRDCRLYEIATKMVEDYYAQ